MIQVRYSKTNVSYVIFIYIPVLKGSTVVVGKHRPLVEKLPAVSFRVRGVT